jgi:hypothetical protein
MTTLVLDPLPAELQELLERRRRIGADHHDEMWEGVYHMAPAPNAPHAFVGQELSTLLNAPARASGLYVSLEFNLGAQDDYRVPDLGVHRERPSGAWVATAALVVEIVSPGDESWKKLPFYAVHDVDDPATRKADWLALTDREYRPVEHSELIDLSASDLVERIDWPPGA